MKYYLYQITNKTNGMIYIGVHSSSDSHDSYMGSGKTLKKAIKLEGRENFDKIILEYFDNKEDMLTREEELVNYDFISRTDTYNVFLGGNLYNTIDHITVRDKDGNTSMVTKDNPLYLNGELIHHLTGYIVAIDKDGNKHSIKKDDPRYLSGDLVSMHKNKVTVKDKNGKSFKVNKDDVRLLNGELVGITTGMSNFRDINGKLIHTNTNDPRVLSGELVSPFKNLIKVKDLDGIILRLYKNDQRILDGTCIPINTLETRNNKKRLKRAKRKLNEK